MGVVALRVGIGVTFLLLVGCGASGREPAGPCAIRVRRISGYYCVVERADYRVCQLAGGVHLVIRVADPRATLS